MTPEQFVRLVDTYGAEPARWPNEWRADAEALARSGDADIVRALKDARSLDGDLGRHRVQPADAALIGRIVASGLTPPWWRRVGRNSRWWLSGVGLVGVGVGGIAAGALAISMIVPASTVAASAVNGGDESSVGTAFGDVRLEGGEQ